MKKFGGNSTANELGYDLELLVSWIEDLVETEADRKLSKRGEERLEKAEKALQLLREVLDF